MPVERRQERVSGRRIKKSVFRVLDTNRLCSIATVARGNRAHINTAFFAYSPTVELYFLSDSGSLHCRNLAANSSMAMTIFNSAQKWDAPGRGLQLFGTGLQTRGLQARRAEAVYAERFPAFTRWLTGRSAEDREQSARLRSYAFFRFLPKRVKILDEAEFGGAVFVIASVHRSSRRDDADARLAWLTTEVLVPDSRNSSNE